MSSALPGVTRLLAVMRALRNPDGGCPWDLAQDSRSLARYTLEEAYELVAAIETGNDASVRDELGDVLFQVVFHAQLGAERGAYDFDAVAAGIAAKLERRHPHVFAPDGRDAGHWEQIKSEERAARGATGVLDDVPGALPALTRAVKLCKRAATVGFDWPDARGPRAKLLEELEEVDAAGRGEGDSSLEDEVGDLLLAAEQPGAASAGGSGNRPAPGQFAFRDAFSGNGGAGGAARAEAGGAGCGGAGRALGRSQTGHSVVIH